MQFKNLPKEPKNSLIDLNESIPEELVVCIKSKADKTWTDISPRYARGK